ncbi:MAG: hypothetical protein A2X28_06955 [Elusimicrobia bacterium GWA2_56_46]|nr:MAG: hypothetical protein A2X28_06955 [Elusimicrobia bacterium GWA2_56_46]OGR54812.1 MAG: hypothetical protein A2X39_11035 [Elusimicrobia bacterium GWC2_56_31]HBB66844.1 hypothetical protein [Elusimicrobiota bacterium]HBW23397.1 hypothetical protein [Elusimicrobiota bacterium]
MPDQFDESSLNEEAITDVETARLALRWALDKIRALQEEAMRSRQNLQEKSSQAAFIENQLKGKNSEIERILRTHEEELKSTQNSLEYQFRSKLERLAEREKELEDKSSRQEEILKQKETRLLDDYQKKSDELRARWAQVEAELWRLRQEHMLKQQEFEKLYAARLEDERAKAAAEMENVRAGFEKTYADRIADLEKRERAAADELKKQEAMLKWSKDSFQAEAAEREKALKQKDLDIEKKLMEKNQEIEDYRVKEGLLQKQLSDLPEAVRKRDEDLNRYKQAMESLESVIRTLENEKKNLRAELEQKVSRLNEALEAEKKKYGEMEAEIPKRLKIAVEHERGRLTERLAGVEAGYKEDLRRRQEEAAYLERTLKTLEENNKTLQAERDSFSYKIEQLQTQYGIKQEEFSFREKQLQSEYDVRLKVELEKQSEAMRNELESARRIYEDNLRLKIEEIAHLRRELEGAVNDRMSFQTQAAELRRAVDAVKAKGENELSALRAQLKGAYERQLSAELAEAGDRQAAEKQKLAAAFDARLKEEGLEVSRKEEELQRLRNDMNRLEAAGREALAAERQRGKTELQVQAASFADTVKIYEDKVSNLNKAMESLKVEREEMILLERERLERLYSEKEKDFDERLYRKDQEAVRLREEASGLRNERANLAAELAREKELGNGRIRVLNEKLTGKEAEFQGRLDEALGKEMRRAGETLDKKNQELDALLQAKETQENMYRKSLEEFRARLSEAVTRLETLKKLADERGARVDALERELDQIRKFSSEENSSLAARLAAKEKDWRELRAEYEKLKNGG